MNSNISSSVILNKDFSLFEDSSTQDLVKKVSSVGEGFMKHSENLLQPEQVTDSLLGENLL